MATRLQCPRLASKSRARGSQGGRGRPGRRHPAARTTASPPADPTVCPARAAVSPELPASWQAAPGVLVDLYPPWGRHGQSSIAPRKQGVCCPLGRPPSKIPVSSKLPHSRVQIHTPPPPYPHNLQRLCKSAGF